MANPRILVVDDERGMLEVCAATLKKIHGAEIELEQDGRLAHNRLNTESFDLLILDIRMPGLNGVELLRSVRERDPDVAALMMTAFPTVETAVESMKLGAADYITKPFLPEQLLASARSLLERRSLRQENRWLKRQVERSYAFGDIIGKSGRMQAVFEAIDRLAATNVDVLVVGETGTGKELVARALHRRSSRREERFVPIDCSAIPDDLLENELFGHERGAFTGAHASSPGLLELANQGTVFLDEIGEFPVRLQVKLLRTLQERSLRRVGGKEELDVDVRIISATSRELDQEMQDGRFRADLYYRINVARIELPPLRERLEDIPPLTSHFIQRYATEAGKDISGADDEVLDVMRGYAWPGNVRELQNVIRRGLALARHNVLCVEDLPDEMVARAGDRPTRPGGGFFDLRDKQIAEFEHTYLKELLTSCHGDVSRAAREAGVPRGTMYRFLKKHALDPESFRL